MGCNASDEGKGRGVLYVCATPIGNLGDITLRALDMLREVDFIVAEDTRVAKRLLNSYGIKKPVISFHEHSPKSRLRQLLKLLESGKSIAIISDAGTPCISDPGAELVNAALSHGYKVVPIPGPSAAIAALSVAGIRTQRFIFLGFLPRDQKGKRKLLSEVSNWRHPIVIYEAPHRLVETLKDMLTILGNRKVVVTRELTKQFEEIFATDLEGALRRYESTEPIGEFTLVIEGAKGSDAVRFAPCDDAEVDNFIRSKLMGGSTVKEVAHELMAKFGMRHREAYERTIAVRRSIQQPQ